MDNHLAITIAQNPKFHDRTKHIEVCYYFLRQKVESEELDLKYVPTGEQVANALTKSLCDNDTMQPWQPATIA